MPEVIRSPVDDTLVADEVAEATTHLQDYLRGRLRDASVSVHAGGVVISGKASSFYVKQLAQHAVMARVSLPITANTIEVQ